MVLLSGLLAALGLRTRRRRLS
ncbi:MAG: IPTL-CTERM sorting domain-containing protein [Myxococcota bacterium]